MRIRRCADKEIYSLAITIQYSAFCIYILSAKHHSAMHHFNALLMTLKITHRIQFEACP